MLAKVLFISPHEVLSDGLMDLGHFFVYWRSFGFRELKSGNLALWNPCYYCGAPVVIGRVCAWTNFQRKAAVRGMRAAEK